MSSNKVALRLTDFTLGVLCATAALGVVPATFGLFGICALAALSIWLLRCDQHEQEGRRERSHVEGFSHGDSVEVDCRLCGQFNRVPASKLRSQRPICGRCKTRLMPGRRIVLCRTSLIEGELLHDLNALWADEDRLWDRVADHLLARRRADEWRQSRGLVN